MKDYLVLVDEKDKEWGKLENLLVHQLGLLHRVFSVYIFNTNGEVLMQNRAEAKNHSSPLWSTTCSGHLRYGEEMSMAVQKCILEQMKISCQADYAFSFIFKTNFENGINEHEFDHVYFGVSDDMHVNEIGEFINWRYASIENLEADIILHPTQYAERVKISFPQVKHYIEKYRRKRSFTYASI